MAWWARSGRAVLLALALAVCGVPGGAALAQTGDDTASVAQLKAALAELRRRLAEQPRPATDAELQVARRQIERLTATMAGLRRERDGLRGEVLSLRDALGTARADRDRLQAAAAEQARRLAASEAEAAQLREAALATAPQALEATEPADRREVLAGSAFASGKAELRADAMVELAAIAAWLRDVPAGAVLIEGFTDASGEEEANRRLSLARAEAVRDRLVALGVGAERLEVVGRGEASPVADNASQEGRAANRRVEISVPR